MPIDEHPTVYSTDPDFQLCPRCKRSPCRCPKPVSLPPGGQTAANLKVAELYVQQFGHLAKTNNTMIVPSNLSDVASVVASAMTVLERTKAGAQQS